MKKLIKIFGFIGCCLLGLIMSCEDIILTNISDDTIALNTPADSLQTAMTSHIFWWNELPGATTYELTVVSPDLLAPDVMALDTIITKTSFTFQLPPGKYQWCVKGLNPGYETQYSCRNLEITQ